VNGHRFEATLWRHDGDAPWHFVTVPVDIADEIAASSESKPFGSVPVEVRIGTMSWNTSLFPDNKTGSYVLPIKRSVRDSESIENGDVVSVAIAVRA
jgi:hypothetical protein